jgi:gas vesicle protein
MKTLGYIAAVIGGAVAGATAALLLAPEKGEDTRAKLQGYAKEYCDKIDFKKTAEDIQNKVKGFCDKYNIKLSKDQVEELAEEVVEA